MTECLNIFPLKHAAVFLSMLLIFFLTSSFANAELQLGVTGHPFVQEGYKDISIEEQLAKVQELGIKWYRTDWYGWAADNARMPMVKEFIRQAESRGISVLPVIISPADLSKERMEDIYKKSFEFAQALAKAYGDSIRVWELGNELDNFAIVRKGEITVDGEMWKHGVPDGSEPGFYEKSRYQKALAMLRGLSDGVRAVDNNAMTIINATYLHYGFLDLLMKDGLQFDVVGWHWYSDMGDLTGSVGNVNLLKRLSAYNKPIWITEFNRRNGSMGPNGEAEQASYLARELRKIASVS
jgi:hypothetical protein